MKAPFPRVPGSSLRRALASAARRFAAAPVFPDDPLKTRRASLLNAMLLTYTASVLFALIAALSAGRMPGGVLVAHAGYLALCLELRRRIHQGRLDHVVFVALAMGWLTLTAIVAMLGSIRAPVLGYFLLMVNVAGLTSGLRAMVGTVVLCSATVGGLMLAENAGLLPAPDHTVGFTQWIVTVALFGTVGGLTHASLGLVRGALTDAEREIARRKEAEASLSRNNAELQETLEQVKTLKGLLPVCGWCRKVRSDDGYWSQLESYVSARTDATFTHDICPDCRREHFPSPGEPR